MSGSPFTRKSGEPNNQILTTYAIFLNESTPDGTIGSDGKALVDIIFQDIAVRAGDTLTLTLQNLATVDANAQAVSTTQIISGTWSFTLHL